MHEVLTGAARWFDRLNQVLAAVACVLLVLITLAICTEIFTRAALDISNPWLVELSEITLLYVTFLGAAWVLGNDKHVSLDLVLNHIGDSAARRLHLVLSLVAAVACFIVTWFGMPVGQVSLNGLLDLGRDIASDGLLGLLLLDLEGLPDALPAAHVSDPDLQ